MFFKYIRLTGFNTDKTGEEVNVTIEQFTSKLYPNKTGYAYFVQNYANPKENYRVYGHVSKQAAVEAAQDASFELNWCVMVVVDDSDNPINYDRELEELENTED